MSNTLNSEFFSLRAKRSVFHAADRHIGVGKYGADVGIPSAAAWNRVCRQGLDKSGRAVACIDAHRKWIEVLLVDGA